MDQICWHGCLLLSQIGLFRHHLYIMKAALLFMCCALTITSQRVGGSGPGMGRLAWHDAHKSPAA